MKDPIGNRNIADFTADELLKILQTTTSDDYLSEVTYQLWCLKDQRATEILLSRIRQETEPWLRERLISALGILQDASTTDIMLEIFVSESEHPAVKSSAALALGWLQDKRAVDPLIQTLESALEGDDSSLAFACTASLGEIGDTRAIDVLIKALSVDFLVFPKTAVDALGKYGSTAERALPMLRRIAQSENEVDRRSALKAIRKIEMNTMEPGHLT